MLGWDDDGWDDGWFGVLCGESGGRVVDVRSEGGSGGGGGAGGGAMSLLE